MADALRDEDRKAIHDFALGARELLMTASQELLEGVYGVYVDGQLEDPEKLPQVQNDPETRETYHQIKQYLEDEVEAGLEKDFAVQELIKEAAFTHLNRFVAFKMMEARDLIRGTIDKGPESNAFKFFLAEESHAEQLALYQQGKEYEVYRKFILWQSGNIAQEIRVLFDPDNLTSRLFPRKKTLNNLLDLINAPSLENVWQYEETIGWVYQFFNEEEKKAAFDRVYKDKKKFRPQDIPAATQLFTPKWIVKFLAQNTLGRLWVQMHPDTKLRNTEVLDYLVPLQGNIPDEELRPAEDITLLDPACGGMHFGIVAYDLFTAMYEEEIEMAGKPGWPEEPSVSNKNNIPEEILKNNIFGIDIDLRAVQLSALSLYLKAKTYNPDVTIESTNLANADVTPLNGKRLGDFIKQANFQKPIFERLLMSLWEKLQEVNQFGSLVRLEKELSTLIEQEKDRYEQYPLFAEIDQEFDRDTTTEEFWDFLSAQIIQGLNEFADHYRELGVDQSFFTGEAVKGLKLLDLMLRRYDVVVTNPPYSGNRNLNQTISDYLDEEYEEGKGDLYAAFILRCSEWLKECGYLGMITQQSFMFLSSYEDLRNYLRNRFAIQAMAHTGTKAFSEISGEKVNTTAFALRGEPDAETRANSIGTYFRLVHEDSGDNKRAAFEKALRELKKLESDGG